MLIFILAVLVLSILVAFLAIVMVNMAVLLRLDEGRSTKDETSQVTHQPRVAVLVPARNEEINIEACLSLLLAQDYLDLEIWLYDDASTDRTAEIAAGIQSTWQSAIRNPQSAIGSFRIVKGTDAPPAGWLGKAHACYRLYQAMRAESEPDYVLFTDADVRFEPEAVSRAVATAQRSDAGLLSIYPRQITGSWLERLVVPMLSHWAVYDFLPLPLAFSPKTGPAFAAANGQFMLFKREVYEAIGGHESVRSQVLEDVGLAREVRAAGFRALLADGGPLVRTRMYYGAGEVWEGYSKNAYAFFGYSPFFLAVEIVLLLLVYVLPPVLAISYQLSPLGFIFAAQYFTAVLTRLILAIRFKDRLLDTLLHPVAVLCLIAVEINSMLWAMTGRGAWKGRSVKREA
jgi:chlorobactene glucosyltransferase